jgi:hypothetical protein
MRRQVPSLHADLAGLRSAVGAAAHQKAATKEVAQTRVGRLTAYRPGPSDGEG